MMKLGGFLIAFQNLRQVSIYKLQHCGVEVWEAEANHYVNTADDGAFVTKSALFVISDYLLVIPNSTGATLDSKLME